MTLQGNNVFLNTFGKRIEKLMFDLETYRLKGSYGGNINLAEAIGMYKACLKEINDLQKQNNELVKALDHKESEIDLLNSRLSGVSG